MNNLIATNSAGRFLSLDGFRGLAILTVTLYRFGEVSLTEAVVGKLASKAVYLGASGVDLFFVLSGFLITGVLLDQKDREFYFARFYTRRSLRIFPLYFVSLFLFLFVVPWIASCVSGEARSLQNIANSITGNTIHLWFYTTNLSISWFNEWQFGVFDHFWSLAIEEQFYLVWPLVVFALSKPQLLKTCIVACVLVVIGRVAFAHVTNLEITAKTFTLFRVDGLLLGATAAVLVRNLYRTPTSMIFSLRLGVVVLTLLFLATLIMGKNDLTIRYTIVSLAGTLLLLTVLLSPPNSFENRFFENPVLCSLGKYSYAMYVFQLPLISLLAPWLSPKACESLVGYPLPGAILYIVAMFGITYLLAVLSWFLFESRILGYRDKLLRADACLEKKGLSSEPGEKD